MLFVQESRTDNITDSTNVFQGDRVFDATLGTWTTPDPYGGDINNPATLKAYLYDNNNSVAYQDSNGNFPFIGAVIANPAVSSNPIGIAVGIIVGIATFFGLFGGGGAHAPGPPPQVRPHDPGEYVPHGGAAFGQPLLACPICVLVPAILEGGEAGVEAETAWSTLLRIFPNIGRVLARRIPGHLGRQGETAVRDAYEIGPNDRIFVNGRVRIPDGVLGKSISEVKNVQYQALTRQLRDNIDYTNGPEGSFDLYLPASARLAGPLKQAIKAGSINRLDIPK